MKKLLKIFALLAVMASLIISCEQPDNFIPRIEAWSYSATDAVYVVGRKETRSGYIMTFMKAASENDYYIGNYEFSLAGEAHNDIDGWCKVGSGDLMKITGPSSGSLIPGTMKFKILLNGNINFVCEGTSGGQYNWSKDDMVIVE